MDDVVCCFCGLGLKAEAAVSLIVYPPQNRDESQHLWAHTACFTEKLDPSVPIHPDLLTSD